MTDDCFDDIVAGFYRAATGDIGWIEALTPFQRALSAWAVYLHGIDLSRDCIAFGYNASDLPAEVELDYIRAYHRIDPRAAIVIGLEPGQWLHCWEHFDDDFVATDPFYQEFLIPHGGRYVSAVKLLQTSSTSVFLGVHRGRGSRTLDATEIAFCRRLGRHLAEALVLHDATLKQRNQGRLGAELLTRLRAPVVLIDDQRRVHHANPAAHALLQDGCSVVASSGRLYCRRPSDDSALVQGLRGLFRTDDIGAEAAPVDKVFLRANASSGHAALGLYLYALRPTDTLQAFGPQPLAMLLLHTLGAHLELDPFVVAAAFDLTPAEARVAVATAHGASVDQIAHRHGVSHHTVRSQLRIVFRKTGAARQAELVSLLASLPPVAIGLDGSGPPGRNSNLRRS
jgi:DNA-binding CsgD family transcriptional regulator